MVLSVPLHQYLFSIDVLFSSPPFVCCQYSTQEEIYDAISTENRKAVIYRAEAANYLGMSRSYLRQDRMNGQFKNRTPGPDYCRFGTMIRYTKEALDQWIEDNLIAR